MMWFLWLALILVWWGWSNCFQWRILSNLFCDLSLVSVCVAAWRCFCLSGKKTNFRADQQHKREVSLSWMCSGCVSAEGRLLSSWSSLGNSCVSLMTRTPHGGDALITGFVRDAIVVMATLIRVLVEMPSVMAHTGIWFMRRLSFEFFHKKRDFSVFQSDTFK